MRRSTILGAATAAALAAGRPRQPDGRRELDPAGGAGAVWRLGRIEQRPALPLGR